MNDRRLAIGAGGGSAMIISPCSVFDCNTCEHLAAERCPGCRDGNDYLAKRGLEPCGMFKCTAEQEIETCADCGKASCDFGRGTDAICPLRSKFENHRWWAGRLARALSLKKTAVEEVRDRISDRTIDRMRWYLTALDSFYDEGVSSISSWQLAQRVGVKAPLIRKDFSRFGEFGTPSLGYDVKYLRAKILEILRLNEARNVLWIGAEKLREHRPALERVCRHNCHLVGVLDSDPEEIGKMVGDIQVGDLASLPHVLTELSINVAVVALQTPEAQQAANTLARAGVTAILNLSRMLLAVPEHVTVRNVDVGGELLALSYYCNKQ